jgi:hypothetical protein
MDENYGVDAECAAIFKTGVDHSILYRCERQGRPRRAGPRVRTPISGRAGEIGEIHVVE